VSTEAIRAESVAPLAPPVDRSFDELAKKVAQAGPRRGSMMQPPPAWQPDEVTLGFAMVSDETGAIRELPEPVVLATILIAVESDRRRILNRLTGGSDEEIDAVSNLFWPLLVLRGRTQPEVAIFDGTGVWKRTFRYTLLPPLDQVPTLLESRLTAVEHLEHMRTLMPYFAHDPGAEVLTVEGFLPVDPPLLFDVLSHSEFRSDPQSPHAGFLPARHEVNWYTDLVSQMHRWLERFEGDLKTLGVIRERILTVLQENQRRLDDEYVRLQAESRERIKEVTTQSETEVSELQKGHRARIHEHVTAIRHAQTAVTHSETSIATADALAFRATHRRTETDAHTARRKQAEAQIRAANRLIAENRKGIERVHDQEREDLEHAIAKVIRVEQEYARSLAERELFRDEFVATASDLIQSIDGQMAARSAQKNLLAGYFLPLPSLSDVRVVWFPLWVATLRGPRGVRQIVFPPMQVRTGQGIGGTLKRLFGGVVLPLEARTAQFDKVLRSTMEEALASDPWLSTATQELTRAADVLADPDVLQRLQQGLIELGRAGWINRKQEKEYLGVYMDRSQRRAGAPPGPLGPIPFGATGETPPPRSGEATADASPANPP
jgi:hypothetical protein